MLPVEATLAAVRRALAPRFDPRLCALQSVENHPSTPRYTGCAPPGIGRFFFPHSTREADLPAQRAQAEAPPRLPCPDVDPGRPRDPQAAPRAGSQAPVGLTPLGTRVQRRHRLSRSRDFDAVYRHGRSVSTRFLVLYWFPRESEADAGARLGLAVPKAVGPAVVRNKMKRRLREAFRARLAELPQDQDYVLVVRPGLAEAVDTRGFDWLGERVDEILGKAAA
jgi:ribonuclease P protein component